MMLDGNALDLGSSPAVPRRVHAEVAVARRYLAHGFLDAALRIFVRNGRHVAAGDWSELASRLLERGRIAEAVQACQTGGLPLPRRELLTLGDRHLRHKDVDAAVHYYELAGADAERWTALLDVLTRLPGRELHAVQVAQRHLTATRASDASGSAAPDA
jgi:hypothetical protein